MDIYEIRNALNQGRTIYDLPLRVTFYARVSTDKDEQLHSLSAQVGYYSDFIQKCPHWTFVNGYVDEGISGTSVGKRENFLRMIEDARAKKFDFIVTKEIFRFSRNTLDSIQYKTGYNITPIVSSAVNNKAQLYYCSTNFVYGASGNDDRNIVITYQLTANNKTAEYKRSGTVNFSNLTIYKYSGFKNGKLTKATGGCVTPDTLVTLADGTQVRIDSLTDTEKLLV